MTLEFVLFIIIFLFSEFLIENDHVISFNYICH